MNKEQREEIRNHIESNVRRLGKFIATYILSKRATHGLFFSLPTRYIHNYSHLFPNFTENLNERAKFCKSLRY